MSCKQLNLIGNSLNSLYRQIITTQNPSSQRLHTVYVQLVASVHVTPKANAITNAFVQTGWARVWLHRIISSTKFFRIEKTCESLFTSS